MYNKSCALTLVLFLSLCFVYFMLFPANLLAVQAYPDWVVSSQPDGSKVEVKVNGDERIHWYESREGYTLLTDSAGYFVYATQNMAGDLVSSKHRYYNADVKLKSSPERSDFLKSLSKNLFYSSKQVNAALADWYSKIEDKPKLGDKLQQYNPVKIEGKKKYLVILMSYPDKPFNDAENARGNFEALFNTTNYNEDGNEGSVKDYFVQNSYGKFTPEFVVVGPFVAANPMAYYEYNGNNWESTKASDLILEAIEFANDEIDYSEFDNDGDNFVDAVTIVFAGLGAEMGAQGAIWPHASRLLKAPRYDGKYVREYCCSAELRDWRANMANIGTFCHEFCHTLGSPDYYDVDYGEQGRYPALGNWCLMSSGNYNGDGGCPAPINAFQKWMFGWIEPQVLDNTNSTVSNMPPTATNSIAYRINTDIADEFFLLENRQRVGFDKAVDGHGLLIWHVHANLAERLNNGGGREINATHPQLIYPVCADSKFQIPSDENSYGVINSAGCPFPGSSKKTFFTNSSVPTAISWSGSMITPITNIREIDTFISFDYNVFTIPYTYNFTQASHFQHYKQDNSTLPAITWSRISETSNWLMELRSIYSQDKTPHEHCLFLPPFYLETNAIYRFAFNTKVFSDNYPGNAKIYLCRSNNINDEKKLLFDVTEIPNTTFQAKQHEFTVTEPGVYYIAIVSYTQGDIMDMYLDDIDISMTVGIYETPSELIINCYPNPANNYLIVDNFSADHIEKIDIVDISGRVLISHVYPNSMPNMDNNNSISIDISSLLSGNYYVLMHTASGSKKLKKIIKN